MYNLNCEETRTKRQIKVSGQLPPRKIALRLGLGFGLGLALELRWGTIFLGGNCPRTTNKMSQYYRFQVISKITVNPRDNGFTITNSTTGISLENLSDFQRLFWMGASKVIAADKNMFNVGVKVTITASIDAILMFLV